MMRQPPKAAERWKACSRAHVLDADSVKKILSSGSIRAGSARNRGEMGRQLARRGMARRSASRALPHGRRAGPDWPVQTGQNARPASPCLFLRGPRSARRAQAGPRGRPPTSAFRRRGGRSGARRSGVRGAGKGVALGRRVGRGPRYHGARASAAPTRRRAALSTAAQIAAATSSSGRRARRPRRSAAARSRAISQIGVAQRFMEGEALGLEAVGLLVGPAARLRRRGASPSAAGRSRIRVRSGRQSPTANALEAGRGSSGSSLTAGALVGARRVGEAVADHPVAARQRRARWSRRCGRCGRR